MGRPEGNGFGNRGSCFSMRSESRSIAKAMVNVMRLRLSFGCGKLPTLSVFKDLFFFILIYVEQCVQTKLSTSISEKQVYGNRFVNCFQNIFEIWFTKSMYFMFIS